MQAKRRQLILEMLEEKGEVLVKNLAEKLNVTMMTIYRDLKHFENEGIVSLTRNGAIYRGVQLDSDLPIFLRSIHNKYEKKALAMKTVEFVQNQDTIFLDGSTTTLEFAKILTKTIFFNLTIITTSPLIITELIKNKNFNIICYGGLLEKVNYFFIDADLAYHLKDININKSFLSARGFSIEHGITVASKDEAKEKKIVIEKSIESYFLLDHSKFNIISTYKVSDFNNNYIVTDNKYDSDSLSKLKKLGDRIIFVDVII